MNCLEYRRRALAEPSARDGDLAAHRLSCRACADWTTRTLRFERKLEDALKVPVPDGLAERVVLRTSFTPRRRVAPFAIAAAVVLAAVLVGAHHRLSVPLTDSVVQHVYHEPELLLLGADAQTVGADTLDAVLRRVGTRIEDAIGDVIHAGLCPIRGRLSAHLVVRGDHGPVTVIVMPSHRVAGRATIADGSLRGTLLPAGRGSIAVLGLPSEDLGDLVERIGRAFIVEG